MRATLGDRGGTCSPRRCSGACARRPGHRGWNGAGSMCADSGTGFVPLVLLLEAGHRGPRPAVPEHRLALVQALAVDAVPALERGEVEQLRPRQRRRCEVAARRQRVRDRDRRSAASRERPGRRRRTARPRVRCAAGAAPPDRRARRRPGSTPSVGADVGQHEIVGAGGMRDAHRLDVVELAREAGDDLPRPVGSTRGRRRGSGRRTPRRSGSRAPRRRPRRGGGRRRLCALRKLGGAHLLIGIANSLRAEIPVSRSSPASAPGRRSPRSAGCGRAGSRRACGSSG